MAGFSLSDIASDIVGDSGSEDSSSSESSSPAKEEPKKTKKIEKSAGTPEKSSRGTDRYSNLLASDVIKGMKKAHGNKIISRGSEQDFRDIHRLPSGVFNLDYALTGGFPVGRVINIYGHKSTSKTSIILRTLGNAQKMCNNCYTSDNYRGEEITEEGEVVAKGCKCGDFEEMVIAFIDVEGAFDSEWAQSLGLDTSKMLLSVPEYAEQSLDISEALIRSGECDILALDSLAFLVPSKEIEESVAGDSWITIREDDLISNVKIRDLVGKSGFYTRGYNLIENRFDWLKVRKVWESGAENKKLFRIRTTYGREIVCTEDHSVYRLSLGEKRKDNIRGAYVSDGLLEEVKGSNIKEGDYLLLDSGDWGETGETQINLIEEGKGQKLWISHESLRDYLESSPSRNYDLLNGNYGPSMSLDDALKEGVDITDDFILRSTRSTCRPFLPNRSIAYLLGLFLGDGCFNGKSIRLYAGPGESELWISKINDALGEYTDSKAYRVSCPDRPDEVVEISCSPLTNWFLNRFEGSKASSKRIPKEVSSWKKEDKILFIEGLVDSDGSRVNSERYAYERGSKMCLSTSSEGLVFDLVFLLASIGVTASPRMVRKGSEDKVKITDRKGRETLASFKNDSWRVSWSNNALLNDNEGRRGKRNPTILVSSGVPVKVCSVEEVPSEKVYDLEVEGDSPTFVANGLLVHNSNDKDLPGLQARLIGRGIRKIVSALNAVAQSHGKRPTIFFTNQIRMKVGVMFGNPEVQPGGHAPGFASSIELRMGSAKYTTDDTTGKPIYTDIKFRVEKNKCGPPRMEGSYRLYLSDTELKRKGEVYDEGEIVKLAKKFGLLTGGGASWNLGGMNFRSMSLAEKELISNRDFRSQVTGSLMKILLDL